MKILPTFLLLKKEWDCGRWTRAQASYSSDAELKDSKQDHYGLDLHPKAQESAEEFFQRARQILFAYQIYPPFRMRKFFCNDMKRVALETTIIQRILLGPIGFETAVRVVDVFDLQTPEGRSAGFSYVTLKGHPERGLIKFSLSQKSANPTIRLSIDSCSSPGSPLVKILSPLARRVQRLSNQQALNYVKEQLK